MNIPLSLNGQDKDHYHILSRKDGVYCIKDSSGNIFRTTPYKDYRVWENISAPHMKKCLFYYKVFSDGRKAHRDDGPAKIYKSCNFGDSQVYCLQGVPLSEVDFLTYTKFKGKDRKSVKSLLEI
jgi:hypothetical protein